jgi:uncharacterized protein YjiS (DUF1127 family)
MAYAHSTQVARGGLLARLAVLKDGVATALQQRRTYSRTLAELNALSDRELADLGIARLAIRDIAHEAAYGK